MPIDVDGNPIADDRCAVHPDRFEPCVACDFLTHTTNENGPLL